MRFRKQKVEEPRILMAVAKHDMYALGHVIRQGDKVRADSPIVINRSDDFFVTDEEWKDYHGK